MSQACQPNSRSFLQRTHSGTVTLTKAFDDALGQEALPPRRASTIKIKNTCYYRKCKSEH